MQQLTRSRTGLLAIILLGAMAIFVVRLFQLQIIQHGEYVARAKSYQQRSFVMPATRGEIYMMDGKTAVPVVLNQTVYTMIADPQAVKSSEREKIASSLREIAGEVAGLPVGGKTVWADLVAAGQGLAVKARMRPA